jgi:hypothetical protein
LRAIRRSVHYLGKGAWPPTDLLGMVEHLQGSDAGRNHGRVDRKACKIAGRQQR